MVRYFSIFLLTLFSLTTSKGQQMINVGFLPQYRFQLIDQIDFTKITHLNLAFVNPDSTDKLSFNNRDITLVIEKAKAAGNQVFISLAGGFLTDEWATAWARLTRPENRSDFISHIKEYVLVNKTDGVDVDLEWSHINENYSGFVIELADTLKNAGLSITASLPCTYRYPQVSDEALAVFDWVNIMAYDLTGSWAPENPGPHSPLSFAFDGIQYWENQGMLASKLTLGVPFYGYDFQGNDVRAKTYREIISTDRSLAFQDQSGTLFYNGIPTIRSKVDLAKVNELKGLMIWELGQDSFDELSLLSALWDQLNRVFLSTEGEEGSVSFFPVPLQEQLDFSRPLNGRFSLINLAGAEVWHQYEALPVSRLNLPPLSSGIYIFKYHLAGVPYFRKVVK